MTTTDMRNAFESMAREQRYEIHRFTTAGGEDAYMYPAVNDMWKGWQAAMEYVEAARAAGDAILSASLPDAQADERGAFDIALNALQRYQDEWDTGLPSEYAQSERTQMECACEAVREALQEARAPAPQATHASHEKSDLYKEGYLAGKAAARGVPQAVIDALRFYANGHHYSIDDDHQQFDTVSGEPQNWLMSEKDDDCTMIEDGSIAKAALCGGVLGFEEPTQPVEGEVLRAAPSPDREQAPYSAPFTTDVPHCCGEPETCNDPCDASPSRECGEWQGAVLSDEQARTVECADSWLRVRGLQTYTDLRDTLFAVLRAIGYTEEFSEAYPDLKVSEGVKLFLAASVSTQAEAKCKACNGNDGDAPCAYPEGHQDCLRNASAPTLSDDARECLMDVVSHHDNIVAGFAAQRLNASEAGDSDNAAYWMREINVAHRMKGQAERALAASAPTLGVAKDERAAFEVWAIAEGFDVRRGIHRDNYAGAITESVWAAWQARATCSQPQTAEPKEE